MILVLPFLASILTVVAFGGRLGALADLRLRWAPLLCAALAVQVAIMGPLADMPHLTHGAAHVASFLMGGAVVFANRRLPGLRLIGLGGGANLAAVAVNGGVMPASPSAVRFAGLDHAAEQFHNSAVVGEAKLAFLGDVLALPAGWPIANVFSVGDVVLVVGGAVVLHAVCGSRLSGRRASPPLTVAC